MKRQAVKSPHHGDGQQASAPPRRPGFRLGPGLVLAFAAVWLLWPTLSSGVRQQPAVNKQPAVPIPAPAPAPELGWLLEQKHAIRLTAAQEEKLRRLKMRWDRDTLPLREALDQASAEFNGGMETSVSPRRSLQELQERAGPLSALSRQLAGARRAYWSEAAPLLTPAQRSQAEDAWTKRLGTRLGSQALQ